MAISVEGWADAGAAIPEVLRPIFEHYVLGTLAVGVSSRSRGFVNELGIVTKLRAEEWLELLEKYASIDLKADTSEVEEVAASQSTPWDADVYYAYLGHRKVVVPSSKDVPSGEEPIAKNQLGKIDGFYRHLRNALAHGRFRLVEAEDGPRLFFFDLYNHKSLSAIGLVPIASLDKLREEACRRIAENANR